MLGKAADQEWSFLKKRTKKLLHMGVRLPDRRATAE
jgi:hypothetical protein